LSDRDTERESTTFLPAENDDDTKAATTAYPPQHKENTEVVYGEENVINWVVQTLSTVTKTLDLCIDRNGPSILLFNEQIWQKHIEMYDRGVRERVVVEITKENVVHCKKMMPYQELRHLDGLKGFLSILDGRLVTSTVYEEEGKILPHLVTSTVKVLVEQHRYFFENLWKNAIPVKKRIREIEEGAKREFVETIRDPSEVQKIGFDLIKNAEEEILVLFSKPDAFLLQEKAVGGGGVFELLKEAASSSRNVRVRMLIAAAGDDNNNNNNDGPRAAATTMTNETIIRQSERSGIDIRRITQKHEENFLKNNLTLLIVDQSFYLTAELNDEANETSEEEAIELATYSNIEATVFAYISIFENLWMGTQL
jgi:hypothetical protein